jgi:hypothetical protein
MTLPTQIAVGGTSPTWEEQIDSGGGEVVFNSARSTRKWLVTHCYDPNDLIASALDNIPPTNMQGIITQLLRSYKYDPTQPTDGGLWQVAAEYMFQPEYYEISFDTSGATHKLMTAIDQGTYYNCITRGNPVPDFKRLVGVSESGVEGVEVPIPKFDFTILIRNRFATLPISYIETIGDLSGRCNDRAVSIVWKGQRFNFGPEELLFLGMNGKMTSEDGFELTLKFSKSKSRDGGTATTASFVQPGEGDDVPVTVSDVTLFSVGLNIFIVGGGNYTVISIVDDTIFIRNLNGSDSLPSGETVPTNAAISTDQNDREPLVIGNSGAIAKRGWRYLWTRATRQLSGGTYVLQPEVAVVNKVIRTADLSPIGIFS